MRTIRLKRKGLVGAELARRGVGGEVASIFSVEILKV
jgi:hypothetical protein